MQVGQGRDVDMLLLHSQDGAAAGGAALALTTRGAFRLHESVDAARAASVLHATSGTHAVHCLVTAAYMCAVYYILAASLLQLDVHSIDVAGGWLAVFAVLAFLQLGWLSAIPTTALRWLEHGLAAAVRHALQLAVALNPVHAILHMQVGSVL